MDIQTWVSGIYFLKMNRVNLSLTGKQLTVFVANDRIQAFKQKFKFQKTGIHH
jgi:hypothetical protein